MTPRRAVTLAFAPIAIAIASISWASSPGAYVLRGTIVTPDKVVHDGSVLVVGDSDIAQQRLGGKLGRALLGRR